MHTDPLFYRIFQERPATVFALAGLAVPPEGWLMVEIGPIGDTKWL